MQAILNAISVVAIAPITDFLLERIGGNASEVTQYFKQFLSTFGAELNLFTVFVFFWGVTVVSGLTGVAAQYALLRIKYDVLIHLITGTLYTIIRF